MQIIRLDQPIEDKQRAELLFAGHLLIYQQRQSMLELISLTKEILRQYLGELNPIHAQHELNKQTFLSLTGAAQHQFRHSSQARELFFKVLIECGVDTKKSYYDHFPLRIVPYSNQHHGAHRAAIGHHRDTWGSNIHSQQNWWAPIFDLTAQRTLAIYPDYWQNPLANTTATWDFKAFLAQRNVTQTERSIAYPSAPTPTQEVNESTAVKVILEPGDVLNFASAHLHASVPNTSDATRFSVEMRTIHQDDLILQRQAPNVDNSATEPMYAWFKHIENKHKLAL
ncbi:MAG: hypothetical protein V7784_22945 [Oceanospirillaceae bacterium]